MRGRLFVRSLSGIAVVVALGLALAVAAVPRVGASGPASGTYQWLIGVEPLCELAPDACPAVARASNGDTVELTGAGSFDWQPKAVTGGGELTHKDANGNVLGMATWEAVDLLSFQSYGSGAAQDLPENFWGGKVLIRIQISVDGEVVAMGILRITCTLGDKIPESAHEGIRLNIEGVVNFNKEVSGLTLFIKQ